MYCKLFKKINMVRYNKRLKGRPHKINSSHTGTLLSDTHKLQNKDMEGLGHFAIFFLNPVKPDPLTVQL